MKESTSWNEAESIQLIREMIEATKYQVIEERFLYLLWGYGVAGAGTIHYLLQFHVGYAHPYLVWFLMPFLGVVNYFYLKKKSVKRQSNTWAGRVLSGIWTGMLFGILAALAGGFARGWEEAYPVMIILYGLASYATGTALEFRWLKIGGFGSIVLGGLAFFFGFQYQLILLILAVLLSFVLPSHMMGKNK
jgi:hypothetical protein